MKKLLKPILKYYLKSITKLALLVYRPKVIVVAGSANKYFFKEDILKALKENNIRARANPKNYNTEIGLPLSILDLPSGYNSFKNWLPAVIGAPRKLFNTNFPKYLVLSLGISNPGDMKYLLGIVKPRIAVLTEVGQRYIEGFKDMDELVNEYKQLAKRLSKDSVFIFNGDNNRVNEVAASAKAKKISFGLKNGNDYQIVKTADEMVFNLVGGGGNQKIIIDRYGDHHKLSASAALILKKYVN